MAETRGSHGAGGRRRRSWFFRRPTERLRAEQPGGGGGARAHLSARQGAAAGGRVSQGGGRAGGRRRHPGLPCATPGPRIPPPWSVRRGSSQRVRLPGPGLRPAGCAGCGSGPAEGRLPAHSPLWSRPQSEPPVAGERAQSAAGPAEGDLDLGGLGGRRPPAGALLGPSGRRGA